MSRSQCHHTGLSDASPGGSSGLDLSEFPALANRSRLESLNRVEGVARLDSIGGVSAPPSSLASRPSYGVVSKPAEPPPDFSIHNEDFPALPGSNTFKSGTTLVFLMSAPCQEYPLFRMISNRSVLK